MRADSSKIAPRAKAAHLPPCKTMSVFAAVLLSAGGAYWPGLQEDALASDWSVVASQSFGSAFSEIPHSTFTFREVRETASFGQITENPLWVGSVVSNECLVCSNFEESELSEDQGIDPEKIAKEPSSKEQIAKEQILAEQDPVELTTESDEMYEVYTDVELHELEGSRERFREFLADEGIPLEILQPRYLGSLSNAAAPEVIAEFETMGVPASRQSAVADDDIVRLNQNGSGQTQSLLANKVYTVVHGKIVEVNTSQEFDAPLVHQGASESTAQITEDGAAENFAQQEPVRFAREEFGIAENSNLRQSILPRNQESQKSQDLLQGNESGKTGFEFGLSSLNLRGSASYLSDMAAAGAATSSSRADGQLVRGRIEVPVGFDAREVIVRVAGTAMQTFPDQDGFFEIGPFSLGSTFELLVFDTNNRLNRRIVPFHVSSNMRERQIKLMSSKNVASLVKSFAANQDVTRSGFCGSVVLPQNFDSAEKPDLSLMDADGEKHRLFFYSERGFPSQELALTLDGRVCAFDLPQGSYRLYFAAGDLRRSFAVHLHASTFESSLSFDTTSKVYAKTEAFAFVDEELSRELVIDSPEQSDLAPVPFEKPLQNFWLTGQSKPVWARVSDFDLLTEPAYAPVRVTENEALRYFSTGEELLEIREANSLSFEILGPDYIREQSFKKLPVSHHILSPDLSKDLRNLNDDSGDEEGFLLFADLDSSLFFDGGPVTGVFVTDIWTGKRVNNVKLLGSLTDRILRFASVGLKTGTYTLTILGSENRVLWTTVVRSSPSSTQIVTNRNR